MRDQEGSTDRQWRLSRESIQRQRDLLDEQERIEALRALLSWAREQAVSRLIWEPSDEGRDLQGLLMGGEIWIREGGAARPMRTGAPKVRLIMSDGSQRESQAQSWLSQGAPADSILWVREWFRKAPKSLARQEEAIDWDLSQENQARLVERLLGERGLARWEAGVLGGMETDIEASPSQKEATLKEGWERMEIPKAVWEFDPIQVEAIERLRERLESLDEQAIWVEMWEAAKGEPKLRAVKISGLLEGRDQLSVRALDESGEVATWLFRPSGFGVQVLSQHPPEGPQMKRPQEALGEQGAHFVEVMWGLVEMMKERQSIAVLESRWMNLESQHQLGVSLLGEEEMSRIEAARLEAEAEAREGKSGPAKRKRM